jgi:hypothetical protein
MLLRYYKCGKANYCRHCAALCSHHLFLDSTKHVLKPIITCPLWSFWVATRCSLVRGYQLFRGTCRLHLQHKNDWLNILKTEAIFFWRWLPERPDDGDSKHLWNVGQFLRDYTAQHPRRQSSPLTQREPEISGDIFFSLRNVGNRLQDYMVSQPRSSHWTSSLPYEPQILKIP